MTCGTELRENAKFCDECGAAVSAAAKPAEYKQVTVLFADVVHSMDIAAAVGAERLREIMTDLVSCSSTVLQRYGGRVDQFTGDGIMALFGAPVALEDHAFRACLAALGIQEEAKRLAEQVHSHDGVALLLRVGLNSGQVIAGEIGAGLRGYTAIGEQVGLAQRMESASAPGEVMLSESTARLVENSTLLGHPQMVHIKGSNQRVPARSLLGVLAGRHQARRWRSRLVGRHSELGTLAGALTQAINGRGRVVYLVGPAGIGKSRLISESATIAARRGIDVFSAYCESHTSDVPFHVVTMLLRAATGVTESDSEAARAKIRAHAPDVDAQDLLLLDDLLGIGDPTIPLPVLDPDDRRSRLTAAINAALLSRKKPAVYVVEDAHWIDKVSGSMLADFLAATPQTHTLTLITYRPEYRGALARSAESHTISLAPLDVSHSAALIAELLGSHSSVASVAAHIAERAAGNPFFAEEMVQDLAERGVLDGDRGGYVCRTSIEDVSMPATLQATIAARIDRLESPTKRALGAASVIGSHFDPDLLDALGIDPAITDLIGAELIDQLGVTPRVQYVFRHPLIRTVAYESQLKSERTDLHRRVASAIEARGSPDEDAALIAEHLEAAGELEAAYSWHMRAGTWTRNRDVAAARSSWERAERLARSALQRGGGFQAAELLSRAVLWLGDAAQAEEILARFDPDDLHEFQLMHWGISRLSILFWAMGDVARAHQVLAELRERIQNPRLRLVVDATESAMAVHENKIAEGIAAAERVLSDPHAPKQAVVFAAFSTGLAMPVAGRGHAFDPIAARWRADEETTDALLRPMVQYGDVLALTYTGRFDLADQRAADYTESSSAGPFLAYAIANIRVGLVATYRGKFPDAIWSIEQALAALDTEAPLPWRLPARLLLARAYAALGRAREAERVLVDAAEHAGQFVALHGPQLTIAQSWLAAAEGSDRRAVELARAAADAAHKSGQYAVEAEALHHAARFGDRTVAARLAKLADGVEGRLVPLYARHANAVAAGDGRALDEVGKDFEGVGLLLSATDSAAQAAAQHNRVGQRQRSQESEVRARRLAAQCGGATTPAINALAHDRLLVVSRERQIADSGPPALEELL